jgi:hypothetical protein
MLDMINPQKGIDLMNNASIINRILFAVTIFQHSPLTRRVHHHERERAKSSTTSGTLTGVSINDQKFFSSSISSTTQRKGWSININTRLRVFSTKLASQHEAGYTISSAQSWHHSTRLATQHHQHEAGITARGWHHIITTRG